MEDNEAEDAGNATVYVSGLKESTTEDAVTLFFENKRRSGGGDLREGKEGYKRISNNVARLTFASSKGDQLYHLLFSFLFPLFLFIFLFMNIPSVISPFLQVFVFYQ